MKSVLLWVGALTLLCSCASSSKQTESALRLSSDLPTVAQVASAPFLHQKEGYCGPATLTMAMHAAGHEITVDELAPLVFTPGGKGSLPQDMISATRRQGLMAIPVHGMANILKEVASGHPVIVFQNLGLNWYPTWHYALVIGYDLEAETLLMHSGPDAFKRLRMRRFEHSWNLADQWALVVLPPDTLSATTGELSHMKAAAGIEQAEQFEQAEMAYEHILEQWPNSLGALIGMGNLAFKRNDPEGAVHYLKKAVKAHPTSAAAKHNLAIAEEAASLKR